MQIPYVGKFFTFFIIAIFLFFITPQITSSFAFAENQEIIHYKQYEFNSDVPLNLHTHTQAQMIDVISSFFCLVTGIDPVNHAQSCQGIDPGIRKSGQSSSAGDNSSPQLGGLIGFIPGMFARVYMPPASSVYYFQYLAGNFGIVRPAHAQSANGFQQLEPIQEMWISIRNVTYLLFVLIFVIVGLGIMLRIKIDPRTVMTLQNQIPRIIICILLITFSYAIVGLMIDLMWVTTYAGINTLTEAAGCNILQKKATENLRNTPLTYGDSVLLDFYCNNDIQLKTDIEEKEFCFLWQCEGGIWNTTRIVAGAVREILEGLLKMAFTSGEATPQQAARCNFNDLTNYTDQGIAVKSFNECGRQFLTGGVVSLAANSAGYSMSDLLIPVAGWFAKIAAYVVIVLIIIWNLFRIWLQLTRAYVMMILYAISGPLWIIMGLLPGKPLGFEKWFRRIFANLVVFPATALLLVIAAILISVFKNSTATGAFVPPLVGNPNMQDFGYLLAFGILLVAPGLLDIIRSSVNAVGKQGQMAIGSIQSTANQGTAPMRAVGRSTWKRTLGVNPYTGKPGALLQWAAGRNANSIISKLARAAGRFQGADMSQMRAPGSNRKP